MVMSAMEGITQGVKERVTEVIRGQGGLSEEVRYEQGPEWTQELVGKTSGQNYDRQREHRAEGLSRNAGLSCWSYSKGTRTPGKVEWREGRGNETKDSASVRFLGPHWHGREFEWTQNSDWSALCLWEITTTEERKWVFWSHSRSRHRKPS